MICLSKHKKHTEHKTEEHKKHGLNKESHTHKTEHKAHKPEHHYEHKHTKKENFFVKNQSTLWISSILLLIFVALLMLNNNHMQNATSRGNIQTNSNSNINSNVGTAEFSGTPADLHFYVMSKCPFGTKVTTNIEPVVEKLGKALNFKLDYIYTQKSSIQAENPRCALTAFALCTANRKFLAT